MIHLRTSRFGGRPCLHGLLGVLAGVALMAGLAGSAFTARAQDTATAVLSKAEGPSWQSLSLAQRTALAPMERDWAGIDATRKAKWLEVAARFYSLPKPEQQRIQERMRAWVAMSPQQRGRARLTFQESRQLAPQERQERWEAYQNLPPERRAALEQRLHTTGPSAADARDAQRGREKKVVINPPGREAGPGKVVAPTVVQAQNGATTSLVNKLASPPVHQQPGMPKIAATSNFVDRTTLLPKRGPQGAESRGVASAASAPAGTRNTP
ncbi:Protein of unknown function (DUF3106) [Burkholderiales bacterium JOSHI_001]|nr:Protein of unknown function (DUF3106) [Burkholderiales bacterium JOSHI_001]